MAAEHACPLPGWYEPLPVFVYGTLRRGFANHQRFCTDVVAVVPAWTTGRLYDLPYGYPAMVEGGAGRVIGELLWFPDPDAALRRLDRLEGFSPAGPSHYERTRVAARPVAEGEPTRAWCYVYSDARLREAGALAKLVPGGDWCARDVPDPPRLPPTVRSYRRTALFTDTTVPPGLLRDHRTKAGVWGVIHVVSGELTYCVPSAGTEVLLRPGDTAVIEPTVPHRVAPRGPVSFYVEFWR